MARIIPRQMRRSLRRHFVVFLWASLPLSAVMILSILRSQKSKRNLPLQWIPISLLGQVIFLTVMVSRKLSDSSHITIRKFRAMADKRYQETIEGILLVTILPPLLLWTISIHHYSYWSPYAIATSIHGLVGSLRLLLPMASSSSSAFNTVLHTMGSMVLYHMYIQQLTHTKATATYAAHRGLLLLLFGLILTFYYLSLVNKQQQSSPSTNKLPPLTVGERGLIQILLALLFTEFTWNAIFPVRDMASPIRFDQVALVGVVGCLICCLQISTNRHLQSLPLWIKITVLVLGPLFTIERYLPWEFQQNAGYYEEDYPVSIYVPFLKHSLTWLWHFLTEKEKGDQAAYPRWYGLAYWSVVGIGIVAPITFVLTKRQRVRSTWRTRKAAASVVVLRKWFHLVAILLFLPTTIFLPQLMSLSYAIALCGLVVLEVLRSEISGLNQWYALFFDSQGKGESKSMLVVSHIFLLLGCATPLWISQCCYGYDKISRSHSLQLLLQLWGVWVLGVGDAVGAVVGTKFGSRKWGFDRRRTLEGSAAMWMSMMGVSIWTLIHSDQGDMEMKQKDVIAVFVSTTIATLLEAFTSQMDNLVLPLVGSIILILPRF